MVSLIPRIQKLGAQNLTAETKHDHKQTIKQQRGDERSGRPRGRKWTWSVRRKWQREGDVWSLHEEQDGFPVLGTVIHDLNLRRPVWRVWKSTLGPDRELSLMTWRNSRYTEQEKNLQDTTRLTKTLSRLLKNLQSTTSPTRRIFKAKRTRRWFLIPNRLSRRTS